MRMNNIYKPVVDIIKKGKRFLVASHAHPDGDGIGSTIALAKGIEHFGKEAVMFNADEIPYNLKYLPYSGDVVSKIGANDKFDAVFMVDCSQRDRIGGDVAKMPREQMGKIVLIDHHMVDNPECDLLCIDADAAATGEVVCRIFKAAKIKYTKETANLLFTTFVVDTGSFRYSNTSSALLKEAAELIDAGANPWAISMALDESNPPSSIKLLEFVLQTFELLFSGKVGALVLSQQMLIESGAPVDVAEEFINYPRSILGVEVAILFRQLKSDKWKVSFRSKHDVDVRKIAAVFQGGGHAHAAGCTIEGDLAVVKTKIFDEVQKHLGT